MKLKEFQLEAVKKLFEAMETPARDIILKSPTGSGKTIILPISCTNTYNLSPKPSLYGLHREKATLKSKARRKWINTFTLHRQNCSLM